MQYAKLRKISVATLSILILFFFANNVVLAADSNLQLDNTRNQISSTSNLLQIIKNQIFVASGHSSASVISLTGTQLISQATYTGDSQNFINTQPVTHLFDGCTVGTPACTTNAPDQASFYVDFDFGALYDLSAARLFGDADGTTFSETWSLEYRENTADAWKIAFKNSPAFGNGWFDEALSNITARYIRVTVTSNRISAVATEAREIEVYGVPSTPKQTTTATTTTLAPQPPPSNPPIASIGDTYVVSPFGNDTNQGSLQSPFKTLQKAADMTKPGDTILIRGGTYPDGVIIKNSGTKNLPVTYKNFPDEHPVFDLGVTTAASPINRILLRADGLNAIISYVSVEGLEIKNSWEGIRFYNGNNLNIRNNAIHDTFSSGIVGSGGSHVSITANKIYHIGLKDLANSSSDDTIHGMHLTGTDYVVTNNIVYDVRAYPMYLAGYPSNFIGYPNESYSAVKNALISNNVFALGRFHSGMGLWQENVSNNKIYNNIFYSNAQKLSTGDVAGIQLLSAGNGHQISNNIFYNPGKLDLSPGSSGLTTATNNLSQDPKFVDVATENFHLMPASPAIDKGVENQNVLTDFDGVTRPVGCCSDIGAYEWILAVLPPTQTLAPVPQPTVITPPPTIPNTQPFVLKIGSTVTTRDALNVRKEPGALKIGVQKKNATGTILEGPVYKPYASIQWWYKINFRIGVDGWSAADYLK